MLPVAYANAVLVDTSAVIALIDEDDPLHECAVDTLKELQTHGLVRLYAVDVTAHETFTRLRYNRSLEAGLQGFEFVRGASIKTIDFLEDDETQARELVAKYKDKALSFHDALCASVMLRCRVFRIFSFDADFWSFGFELVPGQTKPR